MAVEPKNARGILKLVASPEFSAWSESYERMRVQVAELRVAEVMESDDPAVEMMFRAGELDEQAARYYAEYAAIENESLENLAAYEAQRMRATQHWMVAHAAEKNLEDGRTQVSELTAEIEAAKKNKSPDLSRLEERLKESERQRDQQAEIANNTKVESDKQYAERLRLWDIVEESWHRSLHANLARSEYAYQARRGRRLSEALFAGDIEHADHEGDDLTAKVEEAERGYFEHIKEAREKFDVLMIEEFMFSPIDNDSRWVWCVPLIDESDEFNVQLSRYQIYRIERGRALDFIEPVVVEELEGGTDDGTDDPRLDAFFAAPP